MTAFIVRELERSDLKEINNIRNDRTLVSQLGANFRFISKEVDDSWFSNYLNNRDKMVRLAILNSKNEFCGFISLTNIDLLNKNAEYSICIKTEFHGNGAAQFATHEILKHGFNDLGLIRIYLQVLKTNKRAYKFYQKIGFEDEGTLKSAVFKDGEFKDLILMAKINIK